MKDRNIILVLILIVFGVVVLSVLVGSYFSYNDKEVSLRIEAEAQRKKIEACHDKMWKIISQKAQISEDYRNSFDSIYTKIISERYSKGDGTLMKWIKESNPNFDTRLYEDLSQSIEIQRTAFQHTQERMIDIVGQHEKLCKTYPGKWYISNTSPIEYEVISSTRSKSTMTSGIDDEVKLYDNH